MLTGLMKAILASILGEMNYRDEQHLRYTRWLYRRDEPATEENSFIYKKRRFDVDSFIRGESNYYRTLNRKEVENIYRSARKSKQLKRRYPQYRRAVLEACEMVLFTDDYLDVDDFASEETYEIETQSPVSQKENPDNDYLDVPDLEGDAEYAPVSPPPVPESVPATTARKHSCFPLLAAGCVIEAAVLFLCIFGGYANGMSSGRKSGYEDGYSAGYSVGKSEMQNSIKNNQKEWYDSGYDDGYDEGHADGYEDGHSDGYDEGYDTGYNDVVYEEETGSARPGSPSWIEQRLGEPPVSHANEYSAARAAEDAERDRIVKMQQSKR